MTHSRNGSTVVDPSAISAVIKKIEDEAAAAGRRKSEGGSDESAPPVEQPLVLAQEGQTEEDLLASQKRVQFNEELLNQKLEDLQANAGEVRQRLLGATVEPEEKRGDSESEVDPGEEEAGVIPHDHGKVHEDPIHTTEIGKDFSEEVLGMTHEEAMEIARTKVWRNIIFFVYLHLGAVYGVYLALTRASWLTLIWGETLVILSGWGVTGGAHRLWAHRAYKAKWPLKLFLVFLNTIAAQNHIIEWARDHRVHHKFSETDADPHNARRGLFFSHMGWLMVKKHPAVKIRGKTVDVSDLEKDPLLRFQRKFYIPLMFFFNYAFPGLVAKVVWGESFWVGFCICSLLRYCYVLHATWTVNSFAHMYGNRPYDKFINPRENLLSNLTSLGEGWHNFHHTFPFDYRASEWNWSINLTTFLLDSCAAVGLVYDRKKVGDQSVKARRAKTGE